MSKVRWPIARPPGIVVPKSQVLDGILRLPPPPPPTAVLTGTIVPSVTEDEVAGIA